MAYNLPAGQQTNISLSFSSELRPYFEVLYNDKRNDGEGRKEFLERIIKDQIMSYYIGTVHQAEQAKIYTELQGIL